MSSTVTPSGRQSSNIEGAGGSMSSSNPSRGASLLWDESDDEDDYIMTADEQVMDVKRRLAEVRTLLLHAARYTT